MAKISVLNLTALVIATMVAISSCGVIDNSVQRFFRNSNRILNDAPSARSSSSQTAAERKLARDISGQMDKGANPCTDFYRYACGNWVKKTKIPDSKDSYGKFQVLQERTLKVVRKAFDDIRRKKKQPENESVRKAVSYYKACLNQRKITANGERSMKKLIKYYGSWPVINSKFNLRKWNFKNTLTSFVKKLNLKPLVDIYVSRDLKNSNEHIVNFDQPDYPFGRELYTDTTTPIFAKYRAAYKKWSKTIARLLGADAAGLGLMNEVYELERKLAEKSMTVAARRDTKAIYEKMTIDQFSRRINIPESWLISVINEIIEPSGVTVNRNVKIVSYSTDYIKDAMAIFQAQPKRLQAAFMTWSLVKSMTSSLLGDYKKAAMDFKNETSGVTKSKPRWETCLQRTNKAYGFAVSNLFVKSAFPASAKQTVDDMVRNVRRVIVDNLKTVSWMDAATKRAAKEKALKIAENIGYPDFILDNTALDAYYSQVDSTWRDCFANELKSRRFLAKKALKKYGKPVDKTQWGMFPSQVNAYYSPTSNKIVFLAAILQNPFYYASGPRALNYGSFGVVVGHEFSHGFDDQGRQYDKEGNLNSWWSDSAERKFNEKAQCFVDQYSRFSLFNTSFNGNQSLGENIADNGGIKQALKAYRQDVATNGPDRRLPGLSLTPEQLFFVGFGQMWCSKYREAAAVRQITSGYHTLSMFRVQGSVQNSPDFASAFGCRRGSPMNPVTKCQLW